MSTQKLNEALGIESIDSFLSSLNVDDEKIKSLNEVGEQVKNDIEKIDTEIQNYNNSGLDGINLDNIQQPLDHIRELVEISKETIKYIYTQLLDSELVDSELVSSFSKLLEAVHLQISEYINLYKERQSFYSKVKLEYIKHQNKLEQIKLKHQLELERFEKTKTKEAIPVDNMKIPYSQEDLIKQLDEADFNDDN